MGIKKKKKHKKRRSHEKPVQKQSIDENVGEMKEQSKQHDIEDMDTIESKTPPIVEKAAKDGSGQCNTQTPVNKRWDINWLWAGITGGFVVILLLCLIAFWEPEFRHSNYYVCDDPSALGVADCRIVAGRSGDGSEVNPESWILRFLFHYQKEQCFRGLTNR